MLTTDTRYTRHVLTQCYDSIAILCVCVCVCVRERESVCVCGICAVSAWHEMRQQCMVGVGARDIAKLIEIRSHDWNVVT